MGSWSRGGASLVSRLPPSLTTTAGPRELAARCAAGGRLARERRGGQRGRLAQGPWPRVVVGGSPAQTGSKPLGSPWPHRMLVVPPQGARQRGSGSVRTFIGHTPGLGLGWGLSSQVVRRMETLGESSAQGKYRVLGCPGGHLGSSRLHKGFLEAANA